MDKTREPSAGIHSFVTTHSFRVCGPRVNFKARDEAAWEGCAKLGVPEQAGQSVW